MPHTATLDAFFLAALLAPPAPHNLQLDGLSPPRRLGLLMAPGTKFGTVMTSQGAVTGPMQAQAAARTAVEHLKAMHPAEREVRVREMLKKIDDMVAQMPPLGPQALSSSPFAEFKSTDHINDKVDANFSSYSEEKSTISTAVGFQFLEGAMGNTTQGTGSLAALRFIKRICEEDAAPEIKVPRMPQTCMTMWAGGDGGLLDMLIEYAEAAEAHPPPLIGIGGAPGSGGNRGGGSSKVLGSDRRLEAIEAAATKRLRGRPVGQRVRYK